MSYDIVLIEEDGRRLHKSVSHHYAGKYEGLRTIAHNGKTYELSGRGSGGDHVVYRERVVTAPAKTLGQVAYESISESWPSPYRDTWTQCDKQKYEAIAQAVLAADTANRAAAVQANARIQDIEETPVDKLNLEQRIKRIATATANRINFAGRTIQFTLHPEDWQGLADTLEARCNRPMKEKDGGQTYMRLFTGAGEVKVLPSAGVELGAICMHVSAPAAVTWPWDKPTAPTGPPCGQKDPVPTPRSPPTGATCTRCKEHYPYAEPNADGTAFRCYGCRR